jgi:adenylylsulfate kinase
MPPATQVIRDLQAMPETQAIRVGTARTLIKGILPKIPAFPFSGWTQARASGLADGFAGLAWHRRRGCRLILMTASSDNIHPEFDRMLKRADKERLLGQRGAVIWLYGLSGSGKSTLANAMERKLHAAGRFTQILDGDNIRTGLNADLGFSDEDRRENIRRIAEVAKLFRDAGVITFCSFITPANTLRALVRSVIGDEDLLEVYVKASFETCAARDVKGLYAKARAGGVQQFTGRDSGFDEPDRADLVIETDGLPLEESLARLASAIDQRFG